MSTMFAHSTSSSGCMKPTLMQSWMQRAIRSSPSTGSGFHGEYEISQVKPKPPGALHSGLALPCTKMRWKIESSG